MAKTEKRGPPENVALSETKQKEFNQKVMKVKQKKFVPEEGMKGVVYISHLPWGFEEQPMREYFSQFGAIKKLRISRSKKTGNSKGYAYIQFAHDDVAKIVAETMNNYLMFGKLIKCKHLDKPHPETFKNAHRPFRPHTSQQKAISKRNQPKSKEVLRRNKSKILSGFRKKLAQLAEAGIEYKLDGVDVTVPVQTTDQQKEKRKADEEWKEMAGISPKKTPKKTPKQLKTPSLLPKTVDTPSGKMNVLIEDSSDDEISFKTPPLSIRSSKLELVEVTSDSECTPSTPQQKTRKMSKAAKSKGKSPSGRQTRSAKKSSLKTAPASQKKKKLQL